MEKLIKKPYQVMTGTKNKVEKVVEDAAKLNNLVAALNVTKKLLDTEIPEEILNAIELIGEIQALEKKLTDAKDELKASVKKIMADTKISEIVSGEFKANYSEYSSDNFDKDSFKQQYKDLYESFLKTSQRTRFEVRATK